MSLRRCRCRRTAGNENFGTIDCQLGTVAVGWDFECLTEELGSVISGSAAFFSCEFEASYGGGASLCSSG